MLLVQHFCPGIFFIKDGRGQGEEAAIDFLLDSTPKSQMRQQEGCRSTCGFHDGFYNMDLRGDSIVQRPPEDDASPEYSWEYRMMIYRT